MVGTEGAVTYQDALEMLPEERIWYLDRTLKHLKDREQAMKAARGRKR